MRALTSQAAGTALSALMVVVASRSVGAQDPAAAGTATPRPVATAVRVLEAPTIDGALDEALWKQAPPLSAFVQAEPFEGQPASQTTDVRLAYDDSAIFIGVRLHDSDPSQIVT